MEGQETKYEPGQRAVCPHCNHAVLLEHVHYNDYENEFHIQNEHRKIRFVAAACPSCHEFVATVCVKRSCEEGWADQEAFLVWPRTAKRPVPPEVPSHVANEFREAASVLDLSPKASAALSRRCLQTVLKEAGGAKKHNLSSMIEEVREDLSSNTYECLGAIREIGNFAAHQQKDQGSGAILDVESGEAEWNLEVLGMLFDEYYVKPIRNREFIRSLNDKLKAAGRKPLIIGWESPNDARPSGIDDAN